MRCLKMKLKELSKLSDLIDSCKALFMENAEEISDVLSKAFEIDESFKEDCSYVQRVLCENLSDYDNKKEDSTFTSKPSSFASFIAYNNEHITNDQNNADIPLEVQPDPPVTSTTPKDSKVSYPPHVKPYRIVKIETDLSKWKYDSETDLMFSIYGECGINYDNRIFVLHAVMHQGCYPTVNYRYRKISISSGMQRCFLGPKPTNGYMKHKDGDTKNCRLDNLEWVFYGSCSRKSYLDPITVRIICKELINHGGDKKACEESLRKMNIDVDYGTIYRICRKVSYADISDEYFTLDKDMNLKPLLSYQITSSNSYPNGSFIKFITDVGIDESIGSYYEYLLKEFFKDKDIDLIFDDDRKLLMSYYLKRNNDSGKRAFNKISNVIPTFKMTEESFKKYRNLYRNEDK